PAATQVPPPGLVTRKTALLLAAARVLTRPSGVNFSSSNAPESSPLLRSTVTRATSAVREPSEGCRSCSVSGQACWPSMRLVSGVSQPTRQPFASSNWNRMTQQLALPDQLVTPVTVDRLELDWSPEKVKPAIDPLPIAYRV